MKKNVLSLSIAAMIGGLGFARHGDADGLPLNYQEFMWPNDVNQYIQPQSTHAAHNLRHPKENHHGLSKSP